MGLGIITVARSLYNEHFKFKMDEDVINQLGWNKDERHAFTQANEYLNHRFEAFICGIIIDHIKKKYPPLRRLDVKEVEELSKTTSGMKQLKEYRAEYQRRLDLHDSNIVSNDYPEVAKRSFHSINSINQKIIDEIKLYKIAATTAIFQPELDLKHLSFNKDLHAGEMFLGDLSQDKYINLIDPEYKRQQEQNSQDLISENTNKLRGMLEGFILELVEEPQKHVFSKKSMLNTRTTTRGLASDMVRYCLINDVEKNAKSLYQWKEMYLNNEDKEKYRYYMPDEGTYRYKKNKYISGKPTQETVYVNPEKEVHPIFGSTRNTEILKNVEKESKKSINEKVNDEHFMGITKAFEEFTRNLRHVMIDRLKHSTKIARETSTGRIFKKLVHSHVATFSVTGITSTFVGALITTGMISGAATAVGIGLLAGGAAGIVVAGGAALAYYFYRKNRKKKEAKYQDFQKDYEDIISAVNNDIKSVREGKDPKEQTLSMTSLEKKLTTLVLERADLQEKQFGRFTEEPYTRLAVKDIPELQFDVIEVLQKII
jgi:hypothetical protein